MKKYALMAAGLALLVGGPILADDMKMDKAEMKHSDDMCARHCDLSAINKQIEAYKSQKDGASKLTEKEAIQKKIEAAKKQLEAIEDKFNKAQ